MSKKVLKLAGRRPMLLALIMATLALGLLFSGWLTPTPGRAQGTGGGNPTPNVETNCGPHSDGSCTECGPHISGWIKDACPSPNNDGLVVSADSCETVGSAPNTPHVYPPTYQPGSKHQNYTFDCPQNPATDGPPAAITFTVGSVYWNPQLPAKWTKAGSFSSTASVYVTSSDPTLCASPGWIPVDTDDPKTTWNIVTTNCSENNLTLAPGTQWQLSGLGFTGEPAGGGAAYQFDGFQITYSATVDVTCICGCSTNDASGTRIFSYTKDETIECYKVGSNGITVALPTELMGAIGELLASQIADNIPLYGVDASYLTDIVNAITANTPSSTSASAGNWKGGKSPCHG